MARAAAASETSTPRRSRRPARSRGAGGRSSSSVPSASRVTARLGCGAMPAGTVRLPLAGFWSEHGDVVTAIRSVVLAVVVATLLDRVFARRGRDLAQAVTRGHLSAVVDTRLRFVRRLVYAGILLIGVAVAASQFTGLSKLAASILASGA